MKEGIAHLAKKGWIKSEEPLWWDLEISKRTINFKPKTRLQACASLLETRLENASPRFEVCDLIEKREFNSFNQFISDLIEVPLVESNQPVYISQSEIIPVTTASVQVDGINVDVLVSCRPVLFEDISTYFPELDYCRESEEFVHELTFYLQQHGFSWPASWKTMFLPHIRGFFSEQRNNVLIYYPLRKDLDAKYSISKQVFEGLGTSKKFLKILPHNNSPEIKVSQMADELLRTDVVVARKKTMFKEDLLSIGAAKKFKQVFSQANFVDYTSLSEKNSLDGILHGYFPLRLDCLKKSIPVAISTRNFKGQPHLYAYGVYFQHTKHQKNNSLEVSYLPFTSRKIAQEVNQKLVQEFNRPFQTVYYNFVFPHDKKCVNSSIGFKTVYCTKS